MAKKRIYYIPDPILYQKSKKVAKFDENLAKLAQDMTETMRANFGIGLSAVQIGELKKVIAIEYQSNDPEEEKIPLTILVNPKITSSSPETDIQDEGCLSLPNVELPIIRSKRVNVIAQDIEGKRFKIRASGLLARVIQHEIDHLNGEVYVDKSTVEFPFSKKQIRVVFFGTPEFSLPTLKAIYESPIYNVVAVVTETDKPSGRGNLIEYSPVKKFALDNNIPVLQPPFLRPKKDGTGEQEAVDFIEKFKSLEPMIGLVAAYGKIIPKNILEIPKNGFINIHPSLLPKYRGATPIQATILSGDRIAGMTIIKMDEGMDTGPILTQTEIEIPLNIHYINLSQEMAKIGAEMATLAIPRYLIGLIKPEKQKGEESTAGMIKKEDGFVDLAKDSPEIIERKIRAYNPWPGVYTISNNRTIKIVAAHLENNQLILDSVKPEGKMEMDYSNYLRGNPPII